jgi:hypothetical protein
MLKRQLIALAVAGLPALLGVITVTTATAIAAAGDSLRRHDRRARVQGRSGAGPTRIASPAPAGSR